MKDTPQVHYLTYTEAENRLNAAKTVFEDAGYKIDEIVEESDCMCCIPYNNDFYLYPDLLKAWKEYENMSFLLEGKDGE